MTEINNSHFYDGSDNSDHTTTQPKQGSESVSKSTSSKMMLTIQAFLFSVLLTLAPGTQKNLLANNGSEESQQAYHTYKKQLHNELAYVFGANVSSVVQKKHELALYDLLQQHQSDMNFQEALIDILSHDTQLQNLIELIDTQLYSFSQTGSTTSDEDKETLTNTIIKNINDFVERQANSNGVYQIYQKRNKQESRQAETATIIKKLSLYYEAKSGTYTTKHATKHTTKYPNTQKHAPLLVGNPQETIMNDVVTSIITIRQKEIHTEKTFQQIGKTCHDHFDTATKTSEYNERSLGELGNKLLTHKTTLSLLAQSHQKTHHHKQPFSLQDSITYKATMDEVVEIVCDWLDTYDASWYKSLLNNNRQQENYYSFDDKSRYDKALKEYVAIHALPALLRQYHRIILEPQLFATYKKVYNEDFYEHQLDRDKAAQYAYIQKLVYLKNEYPRLEAILENGQRYYQGKKDILAQYGYNDLQKFLDHTAKYEQYRQALTNHAIKHTREQKEFIENDGRYHEALKQISLIEK